MKFSLKHFLMAAAVLCAGTVFAQADEEGPDTRPIVSIDAKNIKNKTDNPRANFQALIDRLNHELVQTGIYRVLNMEDMAKTLVDSEKFAAAADDGGVKTAIQSHAFYIRMTVTTYGFSMGASNDYYTRSQTVAETAKVELILLLVDARTGVTVASKNISAASITQVTAQAGQVAVGNYREQALQAACQSACKKIVLELVRYTPFYILDIENNQITTDIPASAAKVGDLFDIFAPGKKIRNRRTGKFIQKETKVGLLRLIAVGEDSSTGVLAAPPSAPITTKCILKKSTVLPPPPPPVGSPAAPF